MSGVEALVTQAKPNPESGPPKNPNQLVITVEDPEPQPRSCWSRLFCCGSTQVKKNSSSPDSSGKHSGNSSSYRGSSYGNTPSGEHHDDNLSIEINDVDCRAPNKKYLLPERPLQQQQKKTLVLDLDETLVHSSFKEIYDNDFEISINLEGAIHRVFVRKRPYVDLFLAEVSKKWEVVIFTASLSKYADPLLDVLDTNRIVASRLFRESCVSHFGNYVKDLTMLGRNMKNCVIIDNSPMSYLFQPHHAVPITTWFQDPEDTKLLDLLPLLDKMATCDDVREAIAESSHLFIEGGIVQNAVVPNFKAANTKLAPLVIPKTPTKKSMLVVVPPTTPTTPAVNSKTGRSILNSPVHANQKHHH